VRMVSYLLLVALACGGRSSEEPLPDPELLEPIPLHEVDLDALRAELTTEEALARVTDDSLAAYERAAEVLEREGHDCDAASRALREVVSTRGAAIARGKALSHDPELLERARPLLEERAAATTALTARFNAALDRCAGHPPLLILFTHF
jgi:hypothetical protein